MIELCLELELKSFESVGEICIKGCAFLKTLWKPNSIELALSTFG